MGFDPGEAELFELLERLLGRRRGRAGGSPHLSAPQKNRLAAPM
jgi:hypothetical protein